MTTIPPSAKPNIAISEERVKDIRDSVENHIAEPNEDWLETINYPDLLAVVDEHAALEAENERLRKLFDEAVGREATFAEGYVKEKARAEKAEAELAAAQMTNAKNGAVIIEQMVALEHQRPLIEAVMGAKLFPAPTDGRTCVDSHDKIIRAALALRQEKK